MAFICPGQTQQLASMMMLLIQLGHATDLAANAASVAGDVLRYPSHKGPKRQPASLIRRQQAQHKRVSSRKLDEEVGAMAWEEQVKATEKAKAVSDLTAMRRAIANARRTKRDFVIACVGDSITKGSGVLSNETYPARLQNKLGRGFSVVNFGWERSTALSLGDHPYRQSAEFGRALTVKPDAVFLMLGTNDAKPQNWDSHSNDFVSDYLTIVNSFSKANPQVLVYVLLPPPVFSDEMHYGVVYTELPRLLKEVVKAKHLPEPIDLLSPFVEKCPVRTRPCKWMQDGVHPNAEGHSQIANVVSGVVKAATLRRR
mmetsp:Transcript_137207/g.242594  ORF Transcript_137207/g.242594 Transcript_137207/m.242594 type:complete len:314 (-) Transcript_137207:20-961(-)